jgi:hypothetical protein
MDEEQGEKALALTVLNHESYGSLYSQGKGGLEPTK